MELLQWVSEEVLLEHRMSNERAESYRSWGLIIEDFIRSNVG